MTPTEEQRALEEALDRLLEPLADDEAQATPPPSENGRRLPPPMPEIVPLDAGRPGLRDLGARLRWSDRGVFRISRLVAGWGVGLVAFWVAIWIIVR
jgi:hypothetical protein